MSCDFYNIRSVILEKFANFINYAKKFQIFFLTLWNCLYSYLVTILGIWQFLLLFSSNVYAQNSPFWRHYALISLMYLIPKLWGNMIFLSYVIIKDKNIRSKIFETFWHNLWSLQTFPKWQTGYYKSHMTFMYILGVR
jgi:hypothetical protein